ncbi:MAG: tetratricopeptide repeat protein [Pseudonocardiales bacterium]|nr:tetratricopeptide repeat protein [Pseudonocardiales bacterium]
MVESTVPRIPEDQALAEHVNLLRRRFEIQEAETIARDGLQRFPGSADVIIAFGRILLATYRYEDAVKIFSQAGAVLDDDRLSAWRIAALSRLRVYDEAHSVGVDALEKFPNSSLIRIAIGRTYLDSSRPREALQCFSEASTVAPEDWHALAWRAIGLGKLYQWEKARKLAHELVGRYPKRARSHYTLGRVLLDADDPSTALPHFDRALELDPNCVSAVEWRVRALCGLRHYSEAEEFSINSLRLLPRCPGLYVEQGRLFSAQGREDEAVAAAERALAIDPRHSAALRGRIVFLCYGRRFGEAEQAAHDAIERRPDDPGVHVAIAWLKSYLGCYEEAIAATEPALAIDPRNSWALSSRIDFLRYGRRFGEAEQTAHDAIERQPDDPDVHVAIAWLRLDLGCYEEAVAATERALAIDPRHSAALRSRIAFLRDARRFGEAEQAARDAI